MSIIILEDPMPRVTRGDSRRFKVTLRDFNKELINPDWVELKISKPGAADSPYGPFRATNESTGVFFVVWTVPPGTSLGEWIREWTWDIQVGNLHHLGAYQSSLMIVDKTEKVRTFA